KKENKKYYATYFNQAQAHYGNQEYLLALGKITEALRYMPEEKEGRDLKADIEDKLTRTEEVSLKRKEKAEKLMPRLIFLHEKYKYREAFKLSRRILRYNPNQEEARNIQRQDGAVLARSVLDRALEKYRKGKKKKAAKLIARAREYNLEVLKERSRDLSNQADTLLAEKNEKQGYELLNFALLLDPENVLARGLLEGEESGLAEYWEMYRRGDYAKLKEKMEELKAKKPGSKKVEFMEHLVNAQLFLDQAEFKQAREDLVHAVRIDPLHPEVWQFFERLEEVIEIMGL
ncbi:MAG TPA: hypothetical protein VJC03_02995, partial [bacterium]|nr:hypothetical protein [bacterium]